MVSPADESHDAFHLCLVGLARIINRWNCVRPSRPENLQLETNFTITIASIGWYLNVNRV